MRLNPAMHTRSALWPSVFVLGACQSDPGTGSSVFSGDWVVTFPSLYAVDIGVPCTSASGTRLQLEQDGNQVTATVSQGLLLCGSSWDSIPVRFSPGRATGTLRGNRLDLQFDAVTGRFTGILQTSSASGNVEYTDPSYHVVVSGTWSAQHRIPSGAINVEIRSSSMTGQPLPSVFLALDGDPPVQAPQNGTLLLGELTGGRHMLTVSTSGGSGCTVLDSVGRGGMNPEQVINIVEAGRPETLVYTIGCY